MIPVEWWWVWNNNPCSVVIEDACSNVKNLLYDIRYENVMRVAGGCNVSVGQKNDVSGPRCCQVQVMQNSDDPVTLTGERTGLCQDLVLMGGIQTGGWFIKKQISRSLALSIGYLGQNPGKVGALFLSTRQMQVVAFGQMMYACLVQGLVNKTRIVPGRSGSIWAKPKVHNLGYRKSKLK